jgi:hypothetical protein
MQSKSTLSNAKEQLCCMKRVHLMKYVSRHTVLNENTRGDFNYALLLHSFLYDALSFPAGRHDM